MKLATFLALFLVIYLDVSAQFCFSKFDPGSCKTYMNTEFAMGGSLYNSTAPNLAPLFEVKWGGTRFITSKVGIGGIITASIGGGQNAILTLGPRFSTYTNKKDKVLEFYFSPSAVLNHTLDENGYKGFVFEFGMYQGNTKGIFVRHTRIIDNPRNRSLLLFGLQTRGKAGLVGSLISFVAVPLIAIIAISGSQ